MSSHRTECIVGRHTGEPSTPSVSLKNEETEAQGWEVIVGTH